MPALEDEDALSHHRRHPQSFLDLGSAPGGAALAYRFWCLECGHERALSEADAERWAERGVPWRTGTE